VYHLVYGYSVECSISYSPGIGHLAVLMTLRGCVGSTGHPLADCLAGQSQLHSLDAWALPGSIVVIPHSRSMLEHCDGS